MARLYREMTRLYREMTRLYHEMTRFYREMTSLYHEYRHRYIRLKRACSLPFKKDEAINKIVMFLHQYQENHSFLLSLLF